jgi:hypothetical protein
MPDHIVHNEEHALTVAIEAHRQQHGMGDARAMAKFVLAHLHGYRMRKVQENEAKIASLEAQLAPPDETLQPVDA